MRSVVSLRRGASAGLRYCWGGASNDDGRLAIVTREKGREEEREIIYATIHLQTTPNELIINLITLLSINNY